MIPDLADLEPMLEPFELLELQPNQVAELIPEGFLLGKAKINPRDGRPPKVVPVLRLAMSLDTKPTLPQWWDITSKNLIAGMLGHLQNGAPGSKIYKIQKLGDGPRARFTLDVSPVPGR